MADESTEQTELQQLTEQLRAYVTPEARHVAVDDAFVERCASEALALVGQLIGTTLTVPAEIRTRAIIEAGSELFHKRQAPNGISQFADATGTPLRVAKDPMNVARVILQPFLPLGFA
ncbi:head-tail connector protein [Microbacterium phage Nobel]|uniref:Head-to-tail adaptor n=1 Tax=Microbacterium phage Nobel TaxID=2725614 RepID=A0A6M3T9D0_9CAUD|nr:head-tail connector protein [Microbacterium phage Nobel]QJD50731.1 head-to-tail adaptor [Microbacterium phage Nobel]QPN96348.1 head-to-tail adaptor [Microbacterium phage Lunatic]QXO13258.1 head-to-tail adaptor [Microbacterium phage Trireme]